MYISRVLEPVVRRYSEHFKAVVVTGPRQVGKTTMLKHLMAQDEEQGIERSYVTMDDTALRQLAVGDPALFLQRYKAPILIDEIHKALPSDEARVGIARGTRRHHRDARPLQRGAGRNALGALRP